VRGLSLLSSRLPGQLKHHFLSMKIHHLQVQQMTTYHYAHYSIPYFLISQVFLKKVSNWNIEVLIF